MRDSLTGGYRGFSTRCPICGGPVTNTRLNYTGMCKVCQDREYLLYNEMQEQLKGEDCQ